MHIFDLILTDSEPFGVGTNTSGGADNAAGVILKVNTELFVRFLVNCVNTWIHHARRESQLTAACVDFSETLFKALRE